MYTYSINVYLSAPLGEPFSFLVESFQPFTQESFLVFMHDTMQALQLSSVYFASAMPLTSSGGYLAVYNVTLPSPAVP